MGTHTPQIAVGTPSSWVSWFKPFSFWSATVAVPILPACCALSKKTQPVDPSSVLAEVSRIWSMTNPDNVEYFMKSVMARGSREQKVELLQKLEAAIEQISRCRTPGQQEKESGPVITSDSVESFEFMLGRNRKRMVDLHGRVPAIACPASSGSSESGGVDSGRLSTESSDSERVGARKSESIRASYHWEQHEFGSAGTVKRKEKVKTPFELSSVTGVWIKDEESSSKLKANPKFRAGKWTKQLARMKSSALWMDVRTEHFEHSYRTLGLFHSNEKFLWHGNDHSASGTSDQDIKIKLTSSGWTKRIICPDHELKEVFKISLDGQTLVVITTLQAGEDSLVARNVYKRQKGGWFGRW